MRATTRKLLSIQTVLWENLPSLNLRPERLEYLRELAWLELELRNELQTHQILPVMGSEVKHLPMYHPLFPLKNAPSNFNIDML